jgi:hypothetical protein
MASNKKEELLWDLLSQILVNTIIRIFPKVFGGPWGWIIIKALKIVVEKGGKPAFYSAMRKKKMRAYSNNLIISLDKIAEAKDIKELYEAYHNMD